ncbi:MAG TPA: acetyl-CoA carboxylase carboxyltransferase subunit beta [Armatimonadota bacterium]
MPERWFGKRFKRDEIQAQLSDVAEGLWVKCPKCAEIQYTAELARNLKVCKKCAFHFRLTARERIDLLADDGVLELWDEDLVTVNPLAFPQYLEKLESHRVNTGLTEAVVTGRASVGGIPVALGITDPHFKMGTMNSVVGERIARCAERAIDDDMPLILVCGSGGGARMEEGILSLMQMAKTSAVLGRFKRETRRFFISVLTDPSMGGTLASWASLGHVALAEPGAMVGFAGQRVSAQVQSGKTPANYQTSEFQEEHGQVDAVVHRKDLRDAITRILTWAA